MTGIKKFIRIARKYSLGTTITVRKSIAAQGASSEFNTNLTTKVEKGHFVVYTLDGHRFVFPLGHLKSYIFRELLAMSEEEFGLSSSGPITFPCDVAFMEDAAILIHQKATLAKERALLQNLVTKRSLQYFLANLERTGQELVARAC